MNQLQAVTRVGKLYLIVSPYWIHLQGNYSYSLDSFTLGNLRLKWNNIGGYAALKSQGILYRYSIGITANSHRRDHFGSVEPYLTRPVYENYGKKTDASAFLKFDISLPIRFEGDLQVRKSKLDYSSPGYNFGVFDYTFFNWRAIASYKFMHDINAYVMVSESKREPTRTDIFGFNDHYDASNIGDLRKVKPERVIDYELGATYKKFRLNIFWMEYHNEIVTMGDINYLGIQVRTNLPHSRRYGIEGEGTVNTKWVDLTGNFCAMKAVDVPAKPAYRYSRNTPFSPQLTFNVAISKSVRKWKGELWLNHASSQLLDYSGESVSKVKGFYTLNLLVEKEIKRLTFRFSANNLLDKPYVSSGNLNYDTNTGKPVSRNAFWQSGIAFYASVTVKL
jgi:iron complex outermembrane receptor protein